MHFNEDFVCAVLHKPVLFYAVTFTIFSQVSTSDFCVLASWLLLIILGIALLNEFWKARREMDKGVHKSKDVSIISSHLDQYFGTRLRIVDALYILVQLFCSKRGSCFEWFDQKAIVKMVSNGYGSSTILLATNIKSVFATMFIEFMRVKRRRWNGRLYTILA